MGKFHVFYHHYFVEYNLLYSLIIMTLWNVLISAVVFTSGNKHQTGGLYGKIYLVIYKE